MIVMYSFWTIILMLVVYTSFYVILSIKRFINKLLINNYRKNV